MLFQKLFGPFNLVLVLLFYYHILVDPYLVSHFCRKETSLSLTESMSENSCRMDWLKHCGNNKSSMKSNNSNTLKDSDLWELNKILFTNLYLLHVISEILWLEYLILVTDGNPYIKSIFDLFEFYGLCWHAIQSVFIV